MHFRKYTLLHLSWSLVLGLLVLGFGFAWCLAKGNSAIVCAVCFRSCVGVLVCLGCAFRDYFSEIYSLALFLVVGFGLAGLWFCVAWVPQKGSSVPNVCRGFSPIFLLTHLFRVCV